MKSLFERRRLAVLALGTSEFILLFLALAVAFDGDALEALPRPWEVTLRSAPLGVLIALTTVTVVAIVSRWGELRLYEALSPPRPRTSRRNLGVVFAHSVSYLGLGGMTFAALGGAFTAHSPALWLALWLLAAVGTVGTLGAIAFAGAPLASGRAVAGASLALLSGAILTLAALNSSGSWTFLAGPTLEATVGLLGLLHGDVGSDTAERLIWLGDFAVIIDDSCSGSDGIALLVLFTVVYLGSTRRRRRFPHALILLPLAAVAGWLANVVRIASLVFIGAYISPELASGAFHANAGWTALCMLALGLLWAAERLPWLEKRGLVQQSAAASQHLGTAYLAPLLALLSATLFANALGVSDSTAQWMRLAAGGLTLFVYRRSYLPLRARPSLLSLVVGLAVFVVWRLLEAPTGAYPLESMALPGLALTLGVTAIVVPVAEELAFRGFLQRRLVSPNFSSVSPRVLTAAALAVPTVAFALLHSAPIAGAFAGAAYALVAWRSGELIDAAVAHGVTNSLLVLSGTLNV